MNLYFRSFLTLRLSLKLQVLMCFTSQCKYNTNLQPEIYHIFSQFANMSKSDFLPSERLYKLDGKWKRLQLKYRETRRQEWKYFRNFYKKSVSPLVTRSGLPSPKISFKEILFLRVISQKPSEIFLSNVVENITTSCLI